MYMCIHISLCMRPPKGIRTDAVIQVGVVQVGADLIVGLDTLTDPGTN